MTTEQEFQVVGWVARLAERKYGIAPGPATERDGEDDSGLTVDFTFDDTADPIAVEVTRLTDHFDRWSGTNVAWLTKRLASFVAAEGWTSDWSVGLAPETKFDADLFPSAKRMIEWMVAAGLDKLGPGSWGGDVSPDLYERITRAKGGDFTADCADARLNGVILVQKRQAGGILVIPIAESSSHKSVGRPIARAMRKKGAGSLRAAKGQGYVTMLAIDVERPDTPDYLADGVRMPDFPPTIDHLWIFVRGERGGMLEFAFHADRTRNGRRLARLDVSGIDDRETSIG